jgi:hypothetical protein
VGVNVSGNTLRTNRGGLVQGVYCGDCKVLCVSGNSIRLDFASDGSCYGICLNLNSCPMSNVTGNTMISAGGGLFSTVIFAKSKYSVCVGNLLCCLDEGSSVRLDFSNDETITQANNVCVDWCKVTAEETTAEETTAEADTAK